MTIAVSKGIKTSDGRCACEWNGENVVDSFGHKLLGGTAVFLIKNTL